jgi:hypothetical protein
MSSPNVLSSSLSAARGASSIMVQHHCIGKNPLSESPKGHHLTSSVFSDGGCLNSRVRGGFAPNSLVLAEGEKRVEGVSADFGPGCRFI